MQELILVAPTYLIRYTDGETREITGCFFENGEFFTFTNDGQVVLLVRKQAVWEITLI